MPRNLGTWSQANSPLAWAGPCSGRLRVSGVRRHTGRTHTAQFPISVGVTVELVPRWCMWCLSMMVCAAVHTYARMAPCLPCWGLWIGLALWGPGGLGFGIGFGAWCAVRGERRRKRSGARGSWGHLFGFGVWCWCVVKWCAPLVRWCVPRPLSHVMGPALVVVVCAAVMWW